MGFTRKIFEGAFNELEPYFDAQTMEIHQEKHHEGYMTKLNKALEGVEHSFKTIEEVLENVESLPADIQQAVVNNGGGLANHNLFFSTISSKPTKSPNGELADMINVTFGSYEDFVEEFKSAATGLFGSGWTFLAVDENNEDMHISTLPNQESPWLSSHKPILGLDVWEHSYYLNYQNRRPEYIDAFFEVLDWSKVESEWELIK